MNAFHQSIHRAIANENLQQALDANAERRIKGRIAAFASLPNWKERRQRARTVRADVIAHLDKYFDQFIAQAEKNGIIVHRAKDADEAVKIVLNIAKDSPQSRKEEQKEISVHQRSSVTKSLVAKSKSMLSEEINLNHALEKAGHRVVETDLGEYIVQLRGEKPAHIITPAVHLRRADIAKLFHEKLGISYTEDVPTLTNTARKILREVFLSADIGISGINFGVAESGTLCIVTNEGNGRMVTTLPPTHIALMGMERIVPTLDDLALMLSLLPRSATGQKLAVYTQLINSPVENQTRHLVIVDNGRSQLRNSSLKESLYCIRCGACLNACPVFRELGGHAYIGDDGAIAPYPGPIGSVVSPGLLGKNFIHLAQASSLCGACKDVCPVDIDLPKLLTRARADGTPASNNQSSATSGNGLSPLSKFGLQIYSRIAQDTNLFAVSQRFAALTTFLISPFSQWIRLPAFTGWGYSKDFPRFAAHPFRTRWKNIRHRGAETTQKENKQNENLSEPRVSVVKKDKVERFAEELTALGGNVYRVTPEKLNEILIELLRSKNIDSVLMWDKVTGVEEARLTEAGIRLARSGDTNVKAGITGATSAIAETGTLVVPSGKGQPLSASLLPEIHIAVIKSSQILQTLEEAMQLGEIKSAASIALISGPSRTADIEMTLTIGVHGPRELHVFIL